MEGESSCESDISESWSLIDINLNEESLSLAESCSELDKNSESDLKKEESNETELEDFVRKCKEKVKTDFSGISDSDSDASFKNQVLPPCSMTETDGIDSHIKKGLTNDGQHDSADAESIEILDMDDSEIDRLDASGFHHLDFPTYQSDDEESLEGNIESENKSINSTVIKRRRRRVNKSSEENVHSVNSESKSSAVDNSASSSIDSKKVSQKLDEETKKANGHPVYKHYRNNVANTILSLSVGVIFAGVACIAIGHFLGVQDGSEAAIELVETLKKLQVENAALQSRVLHLNRALLNREENSKLEFPLNEPQSPVSCEQTPRVDPSKKNDDKNLNNEALSEIRSSLSSVEWLAKLEDYVRKNNKVTDTEYGIDFHGFRKFLHDQLYILNGKQDGGHEILKETDKISKVLQKVINRLSSSQDHIEKLYERLIKFKNKLNQKVKRIFPESKSERTKFIRKIPVTELDLQTMKWNSKKEIEKGSDGLFSKSVVFYKFPQPESYYQNEKNVKDNAEKEVKVTNPKRDIKTKNFDKPEKVEYQNKRKSEKIKEKNEEKKHSKDNWKKKRFKEKEAKEKKGGKKRKRNANKEYKLVKNYESGEKNKDRTDEKRRGKFTDNQNVFNETLSQSKQYSKMGDKAALFKQRLKKFKSTKLRKVLLTKVKKRPHSQEKQYNPVCFEPECSNLTGEWVFKRAGGRVEIRRHESLGDWLFERAKARKELREDENEEGYSVNWNFRRAKARENNRNDIHGHHEKYPKYIKKNFFHEEFSWF